MLLILSIIDIDQVYYKPKGNQIQLFCQKIDSLIRLQANKYKPKTNRLKKMDL